MSNPFKAKKFKKLQDKWYAKLAAEGFKDLEANEDSLIVYESTSFQNRYDPNQVESTEEYYRLAGQFTHEHFFETPRDRVIWDMHACGQTVRAISAHIKKKRFKNWSTKKVHQSIKQLEKEMIEKYGKNNKSNGFNNH